ncbi:MAG: cation:proton antiporter [Campylobacterales bacterium]
MTEIILATLLFSLVVNLILKKFHIPPMIGYIFGGVFIGQVFDLRDDETLKLLAEYGLVFLMFMLGLEFSFPRMKSMKFEVFGLGSSQMILTTLLFGLLAYGLGCDRKASLVIGLALALSSTAIVLKILQERRHLYRNHGRISVGILLFQDLAVIPILIMLTIIANNSTDISDLAIKALLNTFGVALAIYIFGRYVVSFILKRASDAHSNELFMTAVLLTVLASAWVAHFFGMSFTLGAFAAGMILAESPFKHQIESDLIPFRDLFMGLFFMTVGLLVDPSRLLPDLLAILLLTSVIVAIKILIVYGLARIRAAKRSAIKSALLLSQVGEFSFVILEQGFSLGIFDRQTTQILISVVIISMILTPFLAKYMTQISYRVAGESKDEEIANQTKGLHQHVIIIGFGHIGKRVAKELIQANIPYIAVDFQRDLVYDGQAKGYHVIFGNAERPAILEALNITEASTLALTIDDEARSEAICRLVKYSNPHINVIGVARNERWVEVLKAAGADHVIDESAEVGHKVYAMATRCVLVDERRA